MECIGNAVLSRAVGFPRVLLEGREVERPGDRIGRFEVRTLLGGRSAPVRQA